MRRLAPVLQLAFASAVFLLLGVRAAWAPGSISLDDVMQQLADDKKLIAEINAELQKQKLQARDVVCSGARFGNHWTHLGGARAIPYECLLGARTLNIDGDLHLYDEHGKEIDMEAGGTPEAATSYKQTNLHWSWE
jgi:hypothetical protein